jgi:RNA-directed DNA polymerase
MKTQPKAVSAVPTAAKQETKANDPRTWKWVEASIWTERMLTALGNGVKGGKWFSLIDKVYAESTLAAAWQRVARNRGAAGVDRVSIERFKTNAPHYLKELSDDLQAGRFRPEAVRRTYIPKAGGQKRPLGIPTVKDRIVQTAMKMVLEPIYEKEFAPSSYGFRPGRGCKDALREVDSLLKAGYDWVVDADLKSYFDTIPHEPMMERVKGKISDGKILTLLEDFLKQDILEGVARWTPISGTPQGAVISPLLANLYLHPLDMMVGKRGHRIVRYADDFVILCRTEPEARAALRLVQEWTEANGLTLHPDKTHVGNCTVKGQGFEFLGYRFEAGRRYVRKKSLKALRDKVRQKTKRKRGDSIECIIADLNPSLRGWFQYFKHAHRTTFRGIDGFVRRRLRSIRRRQNKKHRGTGRCLNDHARWPNAYFAERGLFTMHEARLALASQSR